MRVLPDNSKAYRIRYSTAALRRVASLSEYENAVVTKKIADLAEMASMAKMFVATPRDLGALHATAVGLRIQYELDDENRTLVVSAIS